MIRNIFAGVVVDDLAVAGDWYARIFGRNADSAPMGGLLEWNITNAGVLQVVELAKVREIQEKSDWGLAGSSSVTFVVDDFDVLLGIVRDNGVSVVSSFNTPKFRTATVQDPSGNFVTFIEPTA